MFFPKKRVLAAALDLRNLRATKDPDAFMTDSDSAIQSVADTLPVAKIFSAVVLKMGNEASEGRPPEAVLMALLLEGLSIGYAAAEVEREINKTMTHRV